jgi:hypothetical protein
LWEDNGDSKPGSYDSRQYRISSRLPRASVRPMMASWMPERLLDRRRAPGSISLVIARPISLGSSLPESVVLRGPCALAGRGESPAHGWYCRGCVNILLLVVADRLLVDPGSACTELRAPLMAVMSSGLTECDLRARSYSVMGRGVERLDSVSFVPLSAEGI